MPIPTVRIAVSEKTGLLPNTEVEFELEGKVVRIRRAKSSHQHGRGAAAIARLRGSATVRMSTDEILALTRNK